MFTNHQLIKGSNAGPKVSCPSKVQCCNFKIKSTKAKVANLLISFSSKNHLIVDQI